MSAEDCSSGQMIDGHLSILKDISVVIQGDIRPGTDDCIASVRQILPQAEVILSTFENETIPKDFDGRVVRIKDPGAQPPVTCSANAPATNVNRQIATTSAGLAAATKPFSLKIRSDALLLTDKMFRIWNTVTRVDSDTNRLIVPSFFTRNPAGISGYLFHASDWIMFGPTTRMQAYWDIPFVSDEATNWFSTRQHRILSTPTARRMRYRFTPEQHLTIHFAKQLGYRTPEFVNDRSAALIKECERFYAKEMIIATPQELGVTLPKYSAMTTRTFQWLDNTLFEDWLRMYRRHAPEKSFEVPGLHRSRTQMLARQAALLPLFATRHLLSASALYANRRRRLRAERDA
jgi:hypothetical protein